MVHVLFVLLQYQMILYLNLVKTTTTHRSFQNNTKSLPKKKRWKKRFESESDSIASSEEEKFGEGDFNEE